MVALVQRVSNGSVPRGPKVAASRTAGADQRAIVRRRTPRPAYGRIALLSTLLATGLLALSSTSIAFQDVASLFGRDVPLSQRWLARLVPTPSGEAYVPTLVAPQYAGANDVASAGMIIKPVLDLVATGSVSAPDFIPPRVNRDDKRDIEMSRPRPIESSKFAAGVLKSASISTVFGVATTAPIMAFLLPKDVAKPTGNVMASIVKPIARPAALATAVPTVSLASLVPILPKAKGKSMDPAAGKATGAAPSAGDLVVSAYANDDPTEAIEAPFKAILNKPMAIGKDGKPDHWWVTNPIPAYARSETEQKCLATAIYFEARGEPVKGELAVAQVVINRLKNPAYPKTVCGVVYQNKDMRNACQFSFACDGIPDRITDIASWARAKELAKRVLFREDWWNADVGSSTHYHANYVRPRWAREMKKMDKIGNHIFYKTYGGGWS